MLNSVVDYFVDFWMFWCVEVFYGCCEIVRVNEYVVDVLYGKNCVEMF